MGELFAELLRPIFEIVFGFTGYFVGFFVVYLFSLGWLTPAPMDELRFSGSSGMTYVKDGDRYLTADCVAGVGILTIVAVAGTIYWIING